MALYCRPSDIKITAATWSIVAGAVQAAYPLTNLSDLLAYTVVKSTTGGITYRATYGGAQALEALAFINTDATAIQVTNGAGFNQAIAIPATPEDSLHLDPWMDLRGLANTSSTTWDFALTGPTGVAMGAILPVATLRTLRILWDPPPVEAEGHPALVHRTEYGVKLKYGMGVRTRGPRGMVRRETVRTDMLALQRDAHGQLKNFLLVLDSDRNDALYVDLATDVRELLRLGPSYVSEMALEFEEQQKGFL